jgi:hypothetical protein
MLPVKAWRIFYADGSTFDSSQGAWADAPPFGLACVVWYHEPPFKTVDTGGTSGVVTFQSEEFAGSDVKLGLWVDGESYYRVMDLAHRSVSPDGGG